MATWLEEEEPPVDTSTITMLERYNDKSIALEIASRATYLSHREFFVVENACKSSYERMLLSTDLEDEKAACIRYYQENVVPGDWVVCVAGLVGDEETKVLKACLEYALFLRVIAAFTGPLTYANPVLRLHQLQSDQLSKRRFYYTHVPVESRNR